MQIIEINFKYTQDEYVKAERQYLFASKTITKTSVVILAVYLLFSVFYFFHSEYSAFSSLCLGVAVFALIIGLVLYFYAPIYRFRQTSKYQEEYCLIFSNNGIKFKTPTINSELNWNIYSSLWESDDCYYLIQALRMYTLIPKRAFSNPQYKQEFEDMALSNLNCDKKMM